MSKEIKRNTKWNKLLSFPFECISKPHVINSDEFIIATHQTHHSKGDGIYKFNTHQNKWIKIFDYTNISKYKNIDSTAYDNKNKLLYACIGWMKNVFGLIIFDLKTRNTVLTIIPKNTFHFKIIFVKDKLHQIYNECGLHYIYNIRKQWQQCQKIGKFKFSVNNGCDTIYLNSIKSILLLGGAYHSFDDSIYQFSCTDSKWKTLNIKLPMKYLSNFGLVSTKNERYIIILGGCAIHSCVFSNDIFIYDIRNNKFIKSKIKCPKKGMYYAIIINNSKRDEITCFGFINYCYKSNNFINIQLLPQYLIKIICSYFCHEEIYLLKRGTGEHWKINVDCIFL